jgi:hypothetical protein
MNNLISVCLGEPKQRWLSVVFQYKALNPDFSASDVLNNPIEGLFKAVIKLKKIKSNEQPDGMNQDLNILTLKKKRKVSS